MQTQNVCDGACPIHGLCILLSLVRVPLGWIWIRMIDPRSLGEKGVKARNLSCNDSRRKFFAYVSVE